MNSTNPANAILPINLGTAASFDQNVFPLAYYEERGDNFSKGCLLIRATLDEMEKISQLGIDLNKNEDFIFNTRLGLEALKADKAKLQDDRKTLNPFKVFRNYRAARLFHAASKALYVRAKRTSEHIHREERMRVVPSTHMRLVNDAVPPDAVISGCVIELPNGLNDAARQMINNATETMATTNPFGDSDIVSQLRDGEQAYSLLDTASQDQDVRGFGGDEGNRASVASGDLQQSRPTSPQTINLHYNTTILNSIVTANSSNLSGFTATSGDRNSGASVTQGFTP